MKWAASMRALAHARFDGDARRADIGAPALKDYRAMISASKASCRTAVVARLIQSRAISSKWVLSALSSTEAAVAAAAAAFARHSAEVSMA